MMNNKKLIAVIMAVLIAGFNALFGDKPEKADKPEKTSSTSSANTSKQSATNKLPDATAIDPAQVKNEAVITSSSCPEFFPNKTRPQLVGQQPGQLRELCFTAFTVLHSGESKTPVYVIERLNRASVQDAKDEQRTNKFYAEARLPKTERATLDDYEKSGFDRGHMAPAGDMPTPEAMAQSFSLANMVPQNPDNNRGTWSKIEKATRDYAVRASGDVYVFTGPIFANKRKDKMGAGKVWIPTHLYKLIYDSKTGKAWGFLVPNDETAKLGAPVSYTDIVKASGVEFLPGIGVKN